MARALRPQDDAETHRDGAKSFSLLRAILRIAFSALPARILRRPRSYDQAMPPHTSPDVLLLDGATGTELGRRGVDLSLPMWSARAILDAPNIIQQIHREYLQAGADLITANTFRTHERSLARVGMGDRARELTHRAVQIARAVRDEVNPNARVLGSVAPLEDCYKPELAPDYNTCETEHAQMIEHLLEAGVDLILIETMNTLREASAAARQAQSFAPGKWILSVCTNHDGPPATLLSGEPATDLLSRVNDALAVGINCVAAPSIEAQVKLLRMLVPQHVRISTYANIGYRDHDGQWVCTDAIDPEKYTEYAARWVYAGATIIGGCCGTRPATIAALAEHLGRNSLPAI
jgi:S-methylmethionine-dependent homocysteine/selenocysteine methylase